MRGSGLNEVGVRRSWNQTATAFATAACFCLLPGAVPGVAQDTVPAVEFESGDFRLDIKTPPGLVAVEMRSLKSRGGATQLIVSDEMKTELRDDGRSPDRRAKDGIYSGFIPGDLKEEIQRYETNVATLKRDLPIPVFDGREFVELKPGSRVHQATNSSEVTDS
ncbi:MAG UNVERIFIED_CONTAM: hypothetical protein LVR18_28765 [Planctomycetaceae bacterium]